MFCPSLFYTTLTFKLPVMTTPQGETAAIYNCGVLDSQVTTPVSEVDSAPLHAALPQKQHQSNVKSSEQVHNESDSPKTRARKYEIDFLVTDDDDIKQPTKRARCSLVNATLTTIPVSMHKTYPFSLPSQQKFALPMPMNYNAAISLATLRTRLEEPPQKPQIRCSECTFTSPHATAVVAHARISHPRKPYACGVCGRCFGEKGNMNKHHRTVHLRQRKHSCVQCGRTFAFLDGLNRHISMVHLDRRPFECTFCHCPTPHGPETICKNVCGMRFKQKSHHRRHLSSVHQVDLPLSP